MAETRIEWADRVWNPVTGCTKISAGCKNCYAERIASRFWGGRDFTDVQCHPERLDDPTRWRKPSRVFVNSMSDLFHPNVPIQFLSDVLDVIKRTPQHTFMILTKRSVRMKRILYDENITMPDNVWLGVSAENQREADWRIPDLLEIPAAVRFVSVEPMLEAIDIGYYLSGCPVKTREGFTVTREMARDAGDLSMEGAQWGEDEWERTALSLDWVICGAESGPGARPFDLDWARQLKDQCVRSNVPFFLKQARIGGQLFKMPLLDGAVWDQYPAK